MSAAFSYPVLAPTLTVNDAVAAIDFYKRAFGAEERYRLIDPEERQNRSCRTDNSWRACDVRDADPQFNKSPRDSLAERR